MERHIYRCPLGAVKYFMHRRGLAYVLVARILRQQAGAVRRTSLCMRYLTSDDQETGRDLETWSG